MRIIAGITLILALGGLALAQEAVQPQAYDLQAVMTRTLAANPDVQAAAEDIAAAQARLAEAAGHKRPQVVGQAGLLQLEKDPSFSVAGMGTMVFGQTDNRFANVGMQMPLYTGGVLENTIKAARQGVEASSQGYTRRRQQIAAEAAVAYYQALSARQMEEVMQQQTKTLQEALRIATALHDQGMVAMLDVMRAKADLSSAQTTLTQAENGYQLTLTNLKRLMNLPDDAVVDVRSQEVNLALPADAQEGLKLALAQRPEVKELQAYRRAAEAQREVARGQMKPKLGVQAQYDFERASTYPEYGNWSVGLAVTQPFYDGGISRAQAQQAEAQIKQLQAKNEALRQGITMEVTNATLSVAAASKRLASATEALNAAQEAYRFAEAGYKNQVSPMVDVLAAQTALTGARVQQALAGFDLHTAEINLLLATGQLPEGLQQAFGQG